jgi:hypothetical protein
LFFKESILLQPAFVVRAAFGVLRSYPFGFRIHRGNLALIASSSTACRSRRNTRPPSEAMRWSIGSMSSSSISPPARSSWLEGSMTSLTKSPPTAL